MEYIRSVFDKKRIILLISALGTLLLGLILVAIGIGVTGKLSDQQFAKRWCKDDSYAQASAFFSEVSGFSPEKVRELNAKIEKKLTDESISNPNENGRLWINAYSANGKVTVDSAISTASVKAIGVGGDFFLFHPVNFIEGTFFDPNEVNKDLCVLDENTAWVLFGSNNIVGKEVEIGGVRHIVTGVVRQEEGRLNRLAGNNEPTIYLSYESLSKNGLITYINSYEALMPNPLTGYAKEAIKELAPVEENYIEVLENSHRFKWTKLLLNVKNFGTRGMNEKGIVYPYWENIARGYEDYLTPVAVFGCLFFGYTMVIVFLTLIRMWRKRTIHRSDIKDFVERKIEELREKKNKGGEMDEYI